MPNHTEWLPNANPITRLFLARDGTQSSVTENHYGRDFNFQPCSRSLIRFLSVLVIPPRCSSHSLFLAVTGPVLYAPLCVPCLGSEQRQAFTELLSISISKGSRDGHVIPSLGLSLSLVLGDIFSLAEQSKMNPCTGHVTGLTGGITFNC